MTALKSLRDWKDHVRARYIEHHWADYLLGFLSLFAATMFGLWMDNTFAGLWFFSSALLWLVAL